MNQTPTEFLYGEINNPEKLLIEEIRLKEQELALMEGLPHLYGYKWYKWAHEFFESRNHLNFLCAANQISKSSTQIRKCIDWATDKEKWKELWPNDPNPNQFWYIYPTSNQCTIEFETKWQQFLPKNSYKDDPTFGWKAEYKNKEIFAIYFNSGVTVYFKSYKQGVEALETGSVYALFLDEECPEDLWSVLTMRVAATDGYAHMVFTATLGQEFWRLVIEPKKGETEGMPGAWKRQISMYDCQEYMDGTPSRWTSKRIAQVIATCKNDQEVQRRIYGKFIKESGLKYPTFDVTRHFVEGHNVPPNWSVYAGVDIGSGGEENHPAAICFIAVDPTYRKGRVIATWRGDGIQTECSDILEKFREMKEKLKLKPVSQVYDWGSAEFGMIATRIGEPFLPANKKHEVGEQIINTLLKNNMLYIYDQSENMKLCGELSSLREEQNKRKAKDDLIDAFRYCVASIPWDWGAITGETVDIKAEKVEENLTPMQKQVQERRKMMTEERKDGENEIQEEFDAWNEAYGP